MSDDPGGRANGGSDKKVRLSISGQVIGGWGMGDGGDNLMNSFHFITLSHLHPNPHPLPFFRFFRYFRLFRILSWTP